MPPSFPPQMRAPVPAAWQPSPRISGPATPPVTATLAADTTRPKIRLQGPDAPKVSLAPLTLPSPEQLGLHPTTPVQNPVQVQNPAPLAPPDWNELHARLRRLGAVGFHLDQVAGQWRATFLMPASGQQTQHIEASAASEAAAVAGALRHAETLALRR